MGEKQRISGHTKTVALIGSPVEHSGSPAIHNLSFEQLGCDAMCARRFSPRAARP